MRDLGVLIDEKLMFTEHVDAVAHHANRALGLLIRTFQTGKCGHTFDKSMRKPIIGTLCTNVRSILEFCSVIWGGAAETHMKRIDCIQHKFLIRLCTRCHVTLHRYSACVQRLDSVFGMSTLAHMPWTPRFSWLNSLWLLPLSCFATGALFMSRARVNTVKNDLFLRIPKLSNMFLDVNCDITQWHHSQLQYKKQVVAFLFFRKATM